MNTDFSNDPEWLKQREVQWAKDEDNIKEGLPKKQVEAIRKYYFTGKLASGSTLHPASAVRFFPKRDIEGITHCLLNNVSSDASEADLLALQRNLAGVNLPHTTEIEKKTIFEFTFGDVYNPNRPFPFLIGKERKAIPNMVSANFLAECATKAYVGRSRIADAPFRFWFFNQPFFYSLLPFVDPRIFDCEDVDDSLYIDGELSFRANRRFKDLMKYCLVKPDAVFQGEHASEVESFLDGFRAHMEEGDLPPSFKKLWQHVKAEYRA